MDPTGRVGGLGAELGGRYIVKARPPFFIATKHDAPPATYRCKPHTQQSPQQHPQPHHPQLLQQHPTPYVAYEASISISTLSRRVTLCCYIRNTHDPVDTAPAKATHYIEEPHLPHPLPTKCREKCREVTLFTCTTQPSMYL